MKKLLFIIIALFALYGCGLKTELLKNNITEVPTRHYVFKNKVKFDKAVLKQIDTTCLYVAKQTYISSENDFKNTRNYSISVRTDFSDCIRFYSNGCLSKFFTNDLTNAEELNPYVVGTRGIFYGNLATLKVDLFTIASYGLKAQYGILEYNLHVDGDTIFLKAKKETSVTTYVKYKLASDATKFKANW